MGGMDGGRGREEERMIRCWTHLVKVGTKVEQAKAARMASRLEMVVAADERGRERKGRWME